MTKNEIIEKLQAARKAYYNSGDVLMTDAEYDLLEDELRKIDPDNEFFNGVGEDSDSGFPKAKHTILMGSQAKANTVEEVRKWLAKQTSDQFLVEPKNDGISLELNYENGKLVSAITRGNGFIGDNVIENAKKMKGVLHTIDASMTCAVRGEVLLFHEDKDEYFPEMKNCRNAASGIFKRLDGAGSEHLTLVTYDIQYVDENKKFEKEIDKIDLLKKLGFEVVEADVLTKPTAEQLMAKMNEFTIDKDFGFDIDGVVVKSNKVDNGDLRNEIRPKTQIAIKPSLKEYKTTLRDIEWSMTNSKLTPVAIFDGVEIDGATCKRASLANVRMLEDLDLDIGCEVIISRRNMIMPHIERRA